MNSPFRKIRKARVLKNGTVAGYLVSNRSRFVFFYNHDYLANGGASIAINLPKSKKNFSSRRLFPFFAGLLPEGESRQAICRSLKLNPSDKLDMLLALAQGETIGDITVQEVK
jgi:serine/threonine-protein kinase HipA